MSYEKIGQGFKGFVVKDTETDELFKISSKTDILTEFEKIKLLPKLDFLYDKDEVSYERVDSQLEFRILKNIYTGDRDFSSFYKMKIPYIQGIDLYIYIDKFSESKPIKLKKWLKLTFTFCEFYNKVLELNTKYNIFHNDMNSSNIIYNEDEEKMTLIDYESLSTNIPQKNKNDISSLVSIFKDIIKIGIRNEDVSNFLRENFIVDERHFIIQNDFILVNFIKERILERFIN